MIRREVLSTFDALTAVAPRDATGLSRATGHPVTVVPNGVIVDDNVDVPIVREPLVVFTGTMHFPPNEAAACHLAQHVWPRVLRRLREEGEGS